MPSNLFFIINFSIAILVATIGLFVSFTTIIIVYKNCPFRTFNNLLTCNTCVATILCAICNLLTSSLGFHEDWAFNTPLCSFRAYIYNIGIAAASHSKSMHAISHLFFAVLYKHKYLLTWRVNRILILLTWLISLIICLPPFFIDGGYALEEESRSCVISSKIPALALYISVVSVLTPFHIIIIVYLLIVLHVHRSTRRVWNFNQNLHNNHLQSTKREMKLMKQMIVETGILISGGPVFLVLIAWHGTQTQSPPDCLYLIGFQLMTFVATVEPIAHFIMNKQLREFLIQLFKRREQYIGTILPRHTF